MQFVSDLKIIRDEKIGGEMSNVISNVIAIIWAVIALSEWILAEEKEDKIYAAVMMILAMITRR